MLSVAGLSLRKQCGEIVCAEHSVCAEHDQQCYPCQSYCSETSHNYDVKICEQQCQDYIHDFVKHYATKEDIQEALQEINSLKSWITLLAVLVGIGVVFIFITLAFIWSRERRIRKIENSGQGSYFKKKLAWFQNLGRMDKVNTVSETVSDKTPAAAACTQTDLMMATPVASASSSAGQRTNTSSSSAGTNSSSCSTNKLPCEDAVLEFSGYDNFALKVSPVLGKPIGGADLLQRQYSP